MDTNNAQQNMEQILNPTMGATINNELIPPQSFPLFQIVGENPAFFA